jgi:Zn-dependent protease
MGAFVLVLGLWIFSVCAHEFAHAATAYAGGDHTVRDKGYLTFNPLKYLDPVQSLLLPVLFLVLGGIGLPGAAVYIERHRLRSPAWESAVSLAGPAANLVLLGVCGLLLQWDAVRGSDLAPVIAFVGLLQATAVVLNLLPLPGLDGFGALAPWLPAGLRARLQALGGAAILLLLLVMFTVPGAGRLVWTPAQAMAAAVDIPLGLAERGQRAFAFWRH